MGSEYLPIFPINRTWREEEKAWKIDLAEWTLLWDGLDAYNWAHAPLEAPHYADWSPSPLQPVRSIDSRVKGPDSSDYVEFIRGSTSAALPPIHSLISPDILHTFDFTHSIRHISSNIAFLSYPLIAN